MSVETHFSNIQSVIIDEIKNASSQIKIAVSWFTDILLYNQLIDAIKRKVDIVIILNDDDINQFSGLNFEILANMGAEIYLYDSREDTMHQKFCMIDKKTILAGSYNWTKRAAHRNTENLIVFKNEQETVFNFIKQFETLRKKSKRFIKKSKFNINDDLIINDFLEISEETFEFESNDSQAEFLFQDLTNPDLIPFRVGEKWGYCDKNRNVKIPLLFDEARTFCDGAAAVKIKNLWGFIDADGKKICECEYNNVKDFKNGYASVQRSYRIPSRTYNSDGVKYSALGFNNSSSVNNDWGCINRSGEIIIEPKYYSLGEYSDGLLNYSENIHTCGYLNLKNQVIIKSTYWDGLPFSEGLACIKKRFSKYEKNVPKDTCFFINNENEIVIERGISNLSSFYNGYSTVEISNEGDFYNKCGLIDKNGIFKIEPQYINIGDRYNQELIAVSKKIYTGRFEGEYMEKYGFINIENQEVIPFVFDRASFFNNNRARVGRINENNNFSKYGYIDLNGKLVVDYIFDSASNFENNLAKVKIGNSYGYIDILGNQYWDDE